MADIYGDLILHNDASVINLKIESKTILPAFKSSDAGKLIFADGVLYFNNSIKWSGLQFSNNDNQPLIATLGDNWINGDLSFNPTAFNAFTNVSDLTSNNTLFDVLLALDTSITQNGSISLSNISDITLLSPQIGDLLVFGGAGLTNISLPMLASNLELSISSLTDVEIDEIVNGDFLIFDGTNFKNRKIFSEYSNFAADTTFVVTHNLGFKYCMVQIINAETDELITSNYGVVYDSENELTVTVEPAVPVKILIATSTLFN